MNEREPPGPPWGPALRCTGRMTECPAQTQYQSLPQSDPIPRSQVSKVYCLVPVLSWEAKQLMAQCCWECPLRAGDAFLPGSSPRLWKCSQIPYLLVKVIQTTHQANIKATPKMGGENTVLFRFFQLYFPTSCPTYEICMALCICLSILMKGRKTVPMYWGRIYRWKPSFPCDIIYPSIKTGTGYKHLYTAV